ncbi:MAG: phosphodiester glycosidase family protein [Phaeodactylibacter sp.]|nr:phosphodiester glycosidase family protein [Phaeodactylibacter sp.]
MRLYPFSFVLAAGLLFAGGFTAANAQGGWIKNKKECNEKVLELRAENRKLKADVRELKQQLDTMRADYEALTRQAKQEEPLDATADLPVSSPPADTPPPAHAGDSDSVAAAPPTAYGHAPAPVPAPEKADARAGELRRLNMEIRNELSKSQLTFAGSFTFSGNPYAAFVADLAREDKLKTKFYYKNRRGERYYSFDNVERENPGYFVFATNGGMYNPYFDPQGLLVLEGRTIKKLDEKKNGGGNFYMQPNGVFLVDSAGQAQVVRTEDYPAQAAAAWYATQSGPMLVYEGQVNAAFTEGSDNLRIRSGVGVMEDGRVVFVLSRRAVNFYDFALIFKEVFECRNALFLDGEVSRMYCPGLRLNNPRIGRYATIIGIVQERE